jgi:Cof subfamily protein (haloacid dehalogenase superfamily)
MRDNAIIFDLDGTAIDSPFEKFPSAELVEEIKRLKKKYYLSSATGRVWSYAKNVLQAMDLVDPCIISAGTQICNPKTGEIYWQENIDKDSLNDVISVLKDYPEYKILYNDGTEDDYLHGGSYAKDFKSNEPVYLVESIFLPNALAKEVYEKLREIQNIAVVLVVAQKPGHNDIHITNKSATKEHAIKHLLDILGIQKENIIGIGDGNNDTHLFNGVNYKVAMGNAVDELKNLADITIGNVNDNGLAKYFSTLK